MIISFNKINLSYNDFSLFNYYYYNKRELAPIKHI
jgi:hypothetical protein